MQIVGSLDAYASNSRKGYALIGSVVYKVDLPHRESFSPDASYYVGPSAGMKLIEGRFVPVLCQPLKATGEASNPCIKAIPSALKKLR